MACSSGTSNFCTVASDSPNSARSLDAASPSASSTFSLDAAVTCSSASVSPFWQFTAFNPSTYSLPRAADRSGQVGLAARPLAKLAGYFGRKFRVGRTGHQLQGLRHFAVGEHIQERRLPQRDGERCLQRVVEDRITGAVGKVGENDGVFLGQALDFADATDSKVTPATSKPTSRTGTAIFQTFATQSVGASATVPELAAEMSSDFRVPLQALQIRSHIGGVLIT